MPEKNDRRNSRHYQDSDKININEEQLALFSVFPDRLKDNTFSHVDIPIQG